MLGNTMGVVCVFRCYHTVLLHAPAPMPLDASMVIYRPQGMLWTISFSISLSSYSFINTSTCPIVNAVTQHERLIVQCYNDNTHNLSALVLFNIEHTSLCIFMRTQKTLYAFLLPLSFNLIHSVVY